MDPRLWGPPGWEFLTYCAEACDDASAPSYKKFMELLSDVIPCEQCRQHSTEYISSNPVDTSNLKDWLNRFKQAVSIRKAKEFSSKEFINNNSNQFSTQSPCGSCSNDDGDGIISRGIKFLGLFVFIVLLVIAFIILLVALIKLTKGG